MSKKIHSLFVYIFLSAASFFSVFPLYWMAVSATNSSLDIISGRLTPGTYLVHNFQTMLEQTEFARAFWNSTRIAVTATILSILISSMAGYGFEIYRSRKKDMVFNILLVSMMIPAATMIVPVFLMLATVTGIAPAFGLNTVPAVIIPGIASVFLIFFFRQSTKMFAIEILEAARMDGMSEIGMFFRIYIPVMKNAFSAAAIITFMGTWNAFMWPRIVIQTADMHTIPIILSLVNEGYVLDFGLIMLTTTLSIIPIGVVFFALQRHFVAGMMGTLKG